MRGVEVAVGEVVPHAGDLRPRQGRLRGQEPLGEGLDRLANFDQTNPHSVEDDPVMEIAGFKMSPNSIDGGNNVLKTLTFPAAQIGTASASTSKANCGLRSPAGTRSTGAPSRRSSSA